MLVIDTRNKHIFKRLMFGRVFNVLLVLILSGFSAYAQHKPITIYTSPAQGLNFGAFVQGNSGGTISIDPGGSRTATGSLIQTNLGAGFSSALFEIDADPGTLINISNGPDVALSGSNGGSMILHLGASNLGPSFTTSVPSPGRTQVTIGGTLTVGSPQTNPPGNYSGSFAITFIQN
jgi:hypothetical protein